MKEKNLSIELLKFLAVIVVLNSHMDAIYGRYAFLATGGAIGDALFFFVSGFTLFLGRLGRFDNWYKRRIRRIYPTVFTWGALMSFMDIKQLTVKQIILNGGGWFVSCIMIYYVVLYFVKKYSEHKPLLPLISLCIVILAWYSFEERTSLFMYGDTYFKWLFNFLFMLVGAYVGNNTIHLRPSFLMDACMFCLSIVIFYLFLFVVERTPILINIQVFSLFPLLCVIIYAYKLCLAPCLVKIMTTKFGNCLRVIAGLCLEAYIVQVSLIPIIAKSDFLPTQSKVIVTIVLIFVAAYITRCFSRLFVQLFQNEDFDWKHVAELAE